MSIPVLCLPFAGSGASFFRPWRNLAGDTVDILPIELPGHDRRFAEPLHRDVHAAVDALLPEIEERLGDRPAVALFGHSLGAVLAYELARRLESTSRRSVAHLFVSGSPGPSAGRADRATGLGDSEFVARIQDFAGYRHASFDDPEVLELLLPVLRADVAMHEDYKPASDRPLAAPITSFRGREDSLVTSDQAAQWAGATGAGFELVEMPGGHMCLFDEAPRFVAAFARALARSDR